MKAPEVVYEAADLLDALVAAVAEDPAVNRSEFQQATDTLARLWGEGRADELEDALRDLARADAEDYEEWARLPDEHDGDPPTFPEPPWHRQERLREWYLAPADVAACAVLAHHLKNTKEGI